MREDDPEAMTRPARDPRAPVPQLAGTGRLADDLYLISHDERTGRPLLAPRAAGLGLAGALLAELALPGAIGVRAGQVRVTGSAPEEGLAAGVLGLVAGESVQRPVREWLAFLARTASAEVASRLEFAGYLMPAPRAPRWRRARRVPADRDCAFAPVARVKSALDTRGPGDAQAVVVAGLAVACGLGARLTRYLPSGSGRRIEEATGLLEPALREVIAQTQAAVDSAVLAHRI
jgi:hypothetical protein